MPNPTSLLTSHTNHIVYVPVDNKTLLLGSTENAKYVPYIACVNNSYRYKKNGHYYYSLNFSNNSDAPLSKPAQFRKTFYYGKETHTVEFLGDNIEYHVSKGIVYTINNLEIKILALVAIEKSQAINTIENGISFSLPVLLVDIGCFSNPEYKKMSYYLTKQFFLDADRSGMEVIITTNILDKVFTYVNLVSEEPTLELFERKLDNYKLIIVPATIDIPTAVIEEEIPLTDAENVLIWEEAGNGYFKLINLRNGNELMYSAREREEMISRMSFPEGRDYIRQYPLTPDEAFLPTTINISTTNSTEGNSTFIGIRDFVIGIDPANEDSTPDDVYVSDSGGRPNIEIIEEVGPFPELDNVAEELELEVGTAGEMTEDESALIDEVMSELSSEDSITFEELFEEDENVEVVSENYRTYFTTEEGEEVFIIETPQVNERLSETPQVIRQEEIPARNANEIISRMEEELQISEEDLIDDGSEA